METTTGNGIAKALVFRESGMFSRVFGGQAAGGDDALGELIARADQGLALNGGLIAYYRLRPCIPEKVNRMNDNEWNRLLNRRFRHDKWRRLCLDTAQGRCCVAVAETSR